VAASSQQKSLDASRRGLRRGLISRYILYLFGLTGVLFIGLLLLYLKEARSYQKRIFRDEAVNLQMQREAMTAELQNVSSDLMVLRELPELMDYLARGDVVSLKRAGTAYYLICRYRGLYDQVRYLDGRGKEIIRVNYQDGRPAIVPYANLQSKGKRYYFTDAIGLNRDDIYVSPFDLNIDGNAVERPYKPTIRFAAPVFDRAGRKRGIVVLNYLGARLLAVLDRTKEQVHGQSMLLNMDGYWLHHSADPGRTWGFMLPERKGLRFGADLPAEWQSLRTTSAGQFKSPRGVFTFDTVSAVNPAVISGTGPPDARQAATKHILGAPEWKLVSFISREQLHDDLKLLFAKIIPYAAILFIFAGAAAWLLARASLRRALYREHLQFRALHDNLTGIPNRELFMDRVEHTLRQALRYGRSFALLYLDLDGFKKINDTSGHQIGDLVLKGVAARLAGFARGTDTVARMGGDEFIVLLDAVNGPSDAEKVAGKLIQLMNQPLDVEDRSFQISASIGISCYPASGRNPEELLLKADQAMYRAKERGKNCYSFASDTERD